MPMLHLKCSDMLNVTCQHEGLSHLKALHKEILADAAEPVPEIFVDVDQRVVFTIHQFP